MTETSVENDQASERNERQIKAEQFCNKIGYEPKNPELILTALTHRSYSAENEGVQNNERLEFLGDAVLDLVLSDILFIANKEMPEGEMAKARSAVVNEDTLGQVALELGLGEFLSFGVGETRSGGSKKKSILADALEAVIAVLYLDLGYDYAKDFIYKYWKHRAQVSASNPGIEDYKTRFQEALVQYNSTKPKYICDTNGPEHNRSFTAHLYSGDIEMGIGIGRSKKEAEQEAAKNGLDYLEEIAVRFAEEIAGARPRS